MVGNSLVNYLTSIGHNTQLYKQVIYGFRSDISTKYSVAYIVFTWQY